MANKITVTAKCIEYTFISEKLRISIFFGGNEYFLHDWNISNG